jgi:hypothetical protein
VKSEIQSISGDILKKIGRHDLYVVMHVSPPSHTSHQMLKCGGALIAIDPSRIQALAKAH